MPLLLHLATENQSFRFARIPPLSALRLPASGIMEMAKYSAPAITMMMAKCIYAVTTLRPMGGAGLMSPSATNSVGYTPV